ncbi:MAG: hypothetical protein WD063_16570 [Pirellulales bacterium]
MIASKNAILKCVLVGMLLGLGWTSPLWGQSRQRHEDFARDPLWHGVNIRLRPQLAPEKHQDFGFRASNHAGGEPGEIGGTVWRSIRPAWYAKVIEPRNLENRLTASGKLALTRATHIEGWQTGSTIFMGFFNSAEQGWRPINFLGFALSGTNEPVGAATVDMSYGTSRYEAGGSLLKADKIPPIAPDGKSHTWSIDYDPEGNSGQGTFTFKFDGAEIVLSPLVEHRKHGATFDRFGIFNLQLPGNAITAFFDDVTINGVREAFASDPGWDAKGNDEKFEDLLGYGMNDFGFSMTNYAGGKPGEIGGRLWQVQEPEYFAHFGDDIGRLSLKDKLTASGKIAFRRFSIDCALHFGWYNADTQGFPIRNYLGVYMDSYSTVGRFITPAYATSRARLESGADGRKRVVGAHGGGYDVLIQPDGRVYDWTIHYDPDAKGGQGAITLTLGEKSTMLDLLPEHRAAGAVFNRFGIFNAQGNNGKDAVLYLDDLKYTAGR